MRRRTLLTAAIAATAFATQGAHAETYDDILRAKRIRVATDLALPPAGMVDAQMRPIGADVEVAQLLAGDWGVQLDFVPTTGPTRIPNLQTGKCDIIISTLSVTPERARVIDFSRAYAVLQSVIGARKGLALHGYGDLKDRTVAVTRGTTQDTELTGIAAQYGFHVVRYDDDATLVTAAVTGQADIVATSASLVAQMGTRNPARGFTLQFLIRNFDLAIGVRKNDAVLLGKINDWIGVNLKNGKLNTIFRKYYGTDLPAAMHGA